MISSKIGFVKRFRLRLSIVSRHSANAELQIAECKLKNAKWKEQILNVKCQQKTPKAERILNFCTLQFFRQGRIPSGDILQCCIHEVAFGEFVNTRVYRKAQKGYVRKNDERNPQRGRYVAETDKR